MASLSDVVVLGVLFWFCVRRLRAYLRPRPSALERETAEVLDVLDDCDESVESASLPLEGVRLTAAKRSRCRKSCAATLAMTAYLKFGSRPKSEANLIITRKFISDLLSENKSMRLKDKIEIMDLAVFLSFVPTKTKLQCDAMSETDAYAERVLGEWAEEK